MATLAAVVHVANNAYACARPCPISHRIICAPRARGIFFADGSRGKRGLRFFHRLPRECLPSCARPAHHQASRLPGFCCPPCPPPQTPRQWPAPCAAFCDRPATVQRSRRPAATYPYRSSPSKRPATSRTRGNRPAAKLRRAKVALGQPAAFRKTEMSDGAAGD